MTNRVVLAYSGEGETGEVIRELATRVADVVTLTLDLGHGRDLEEVRARAFTLGAARAHVLDVREEFVRDFVLPALQAGVPHIGAGVFAEALGHAILARKLGEIAAIEGTLAVAHGEVGDNRRRLEANLAAVNGSMTVLDVSRPGRHPSERRFRNLWGRYLVRPGSLTRTPDTPASIDVSFDCGVPVAINGIRMALVELIESVSTIGERHGIGRLSDDDGTDERVDSTGTPGRESESPAAVILHATLRALEAAVLPPERIQAQREQATRYADVVNEGRWFTEARIQLDAFNARVQQMLTGTVRVKLFEGSLLSSSVVESGVAVLRS